MTIEEKIRVLCVRSRVSMSELARRLGQTPQGFNGKLKRQTFSVSELEKIATALGCTYEHSFVLPNGERV